MEKEFIPPNRILLSIQLGMDGRTRKLSIPKWALGAFFVAQILLFVCTIVMLVNWVGTSSREAMIAKLQSENSNLRNKMETSLGMLNARLDSLNTIIHPASADSLAKAKSADYPYYSGKTNTGDSKYLLSVQNRLELIRDRLDEIDAIYGHDQLANISDTEPNGSRPVVKSGAPSIYPAFGEIVDGFGMRPSPFTGEDEYHWGIDLANDPGTPIYATASGVILKTKYEEGYGKFIRIDHQNGYETLYGHMSSFKVREGDIVKKGQIIGYMGSTGKSTGPHVHYEVWAGGSKVNPADYLNLIENYASAN